jgi:hypothetical protein
MWFVYERVHIYCQEKNDALSEALHLERLFAIEYGTKGKALLRGEILSVLTN